MIFCYFKKINKQKGTILIQSIVFGAIAIIFISGLASWGAINIKASKSVINKELAFQIAEAGIEYYRWHLAHSPEDYQDGTGAPGPYVHPYYDKDGVQIGSFSLDITAPLIGSTLVTIRSTGTVVSDSTVSSIVEVQLAKPSLAKYAVATDNDIRFGGGTEIFGPVHSNGGIRFEGDVVHNVITSSRESYDDPDSDDCNTDGTSFGVHTCSAPSDPDFPAPVPPRPDVFEAGRQFPVPEIDFIGFSSDLAQIKIDAQASGLYFSDSGALGYHVALRTNDTFELFRVDSYRFPTGFSAPWCIDWSNETATNSTAWGTWSIGTETSLGVYSFPSNGLIFLEDDVWVDGNIDTARLTIASGRFPENPATYTKIVVNNDLLYTNYDGQDVIALMSQGDIGTGLFSEDDLRIDAALVAQNGRVNRNFYWYRHPGFPVCGDTSQRTSVTFYGIMVTNQRYYYSLGCGWNCWSGYSNRNMIYDSNLLYSPPPSFPLISEQYETVSWKKIK